MLQEFVDLSRKVLCERKVLIGDYASLNHCTVEMFVEENYESESTLRPTREINNELDLR